MRTLAGLSMASTFDVSYIGSNCAAASIMRGPQNFGHVYLQVVLRHPRRQTTPVLINPMTQGCLHCSNSAALSRTAVCNMYSRHCPHWMRINGPVEFLGICPEFLLHMRFRGPTIDLHCTLPLFSSVPRTRKRKLLQNKD
ncbi:hypothetical protein BV22DRAFT_492376 [Leucogyrophana mollusca]|uniref:Uncharacterized protein n=1 Tax=Leucogyrophana mollusca TaxID=85980 RepID=A0ACB8BH62_9AGAM|nr:hypothetical protein BV22DRAFT_492376 [Leucogyrophana mollusca]